MPEPLRTAERWREEVARAGLGDLFLVGVEGFQGELEPAKIGFDASVDFAPRWRQLTHDGLFRSRAFRRMVRWGLLPPVYFENKVVSYDTVVSRGLAAKDPPFLRFGCVAPGFDNSARRRDRALILINWDPPCTNRGSERSSHGPQNARMWTSGSSSSMRGTSGRRGIIWSRTRTGAWRISRLRVVRSVTPMRSEFFSGLRRRLEFRVPPAW